MLAFFCGLTVTLERSDRDFKIVSLRLTATPTNHSKKRVKLKTQIFSLFLIKNNKIFQKKHKKAKKSVFGVQNSLQWFVLYAKII